MKVIQDRLLQDVELLRHKEAGKVLYENKLTRLYGFHNKSWISAIIVAALLVS